MIDCWIPPVAPLPPIAAWWGWLGVGVVGAMPFAAPLIQLSSGNAKRSFNLTAFAGLLGIAVVVLLISTLRQRVVGRLLREWVLVAWPGLVVVLVASGGLYPVLAHDGTVKLFIKSWLQQVEYLLLAPLIFMTILREERWRNRAFFALAVVTMLTVLQALYQFTWWSRDPATAWVAHDIGGLLLNRNTFGLFTGVAVCLLADWLGGFRRQFLTLLLIGFLVVLASCAFSAGGLLVAFFAGVAVVFGRRYGVLSPLILWLLVSVFLVVAQVDKPAARLSVLADSIQVHHEVVDPETQFSQLRPAIRYSRWMANLNMARTHPWWGVGLGQYKRNLPAAYGSFNRPEGRTDRPTEYDISTNEPFTFGWIFLAAGEMGVPGLLAVLVFLATLLTRAVGDETRRPMRFAGGILGAVVVLLIAALWTNPLVRGTGPLLGFLLAASAIPGESRTSTAEPREHG